MLEGEYGHGLFGAPDNDEHPMFQWLHIRGNEQTTVTLAKMMPVWYMAHWYHSRMRPCKGKECKLCFMGVGRQRRWVFPVIVWRKRTPFFWEVSDHVAETIKEAAERYSAVEGLKLIVQREGSDRKARLEVNCTGIDSSEAWKEVHFPPIENALELTWQQIPTQLSDTFEETEVRSEY